MSVRWYTLHYDDGATERVQAASPARAVRGRARTLLPHTVTSPGLTGRLLQRHNYNPTPLRTRMAAECWD